MTWWSQARGQRWIGSALASVWLGLSQPACDRRFEFDLETGGAGTGAASSASGAAHGGSASAGARSDAGNSGSGGQGGSSVAGSGGEAGSAAGSTACGALSACTAGTHCAAGQCVQCAVDDDCLIHGLARCEPSRHRCVACVTTLDCQDGFACDSLANRCLQTCSATVPCPKDAHGCDERRQVCYQCDEDRECETSPLGQLCASDGSGCVECRKEADCPDQHCDQLSGRCVECRDGGDCSSQICDPSTFTCATD